MAIGSAPAFGVGTLTSTGVLVDTQTVVVGGKTYTWQDTLTDVDGNVDTGADAEAGLANLKNAINLTGTPGTGYAASMTKNAQVYCTAVTATTLVVSAHVPGTIGNLVASTETGTNTAWGGATLASGTGDIGDWIQDLISLNQINSEVLQAIKTITPQSD